MRADKQLGGRPHAGRRGPARPTPAPAKVGYTCTRLGRVSGWGNGVLPPRGCGPVQQAGGRLFEPPAPRLFDLMMQAAQWRKVALAGQTALIIWDRMILIALPRWPPTSREHTRFVAYFDQVPQRGRRLIAAALPAMLTCTRRERADLHRELPASTGPCGCQSAARAAMSGRLAIVVGDCDTPAHSRAAPGREEKLVKR